MNVKLAPSTEIIAQDYERAGAIYSKLDPTFVGRLTLSQSDSGAIIDLESVYGVVLETIQDSPELAMQHASTFGALNVRFALNGQPTSYSFDRLVDRPPADSAEISTLPVNSISKIFSYEDIDGQYTYLLADGGGPLTTEMGLIQALHMVDTALVTEQFDGRPPNVQLISDEDLLKLRSDNPQMFLRLYGNIRGAEDTPTILGSVIPTSLLESSNVETQGLGTAVGDSPQVLEAEPLTIPENEGKKALIGITTAKKPHIGHMFLLAKAIASNQTGDGIVVELNDQGPRVDRALAVIAQERGIPLGDVAALATKGELTIEEIQEAYRERENVKLPSSIEDYSLTEPNDYFRNILANIAPDGVAIESVADSDLLVQYRAIRDKYPFVQLFGSESGVRILPAKEAEEQAIVIEAAGKLTLAGVIAINGISSALQSVDSPPPISTKQNKLLQQYGIEIEQETGTGVMIDGQLASGTNGNSLSVDDLLEIAKSKELPAAMLLPAVRLMMDRGFYLPSDGASVSLNYATKTAMIEELYSAIDDIQKLDIGDEILKRELRTQDIKRQALRSIFGSADEASGKPSIEEVASLIERLPVLEEKFSEELVGALSTIQSGVIPKNRISQADRKIIQGIRSGNVNIILELLEKQCEADEQVFQEIIESSMLREVMTAMGYTRSEMSSFLQIVKESKGIYTAV